MIKTCCQELIALGSHHDDKWPSHLSTLLWKKRRKYLVMMWLGRLRGEWDNAVGYQRASLASLAEINLKGPFLNIASPIQNSQICSCWPSLHHLHNIKSHWSEMLHSTMSLGESSDSLVCVADDLRVKSWSRHFTWKYQIEFLIMNKPCQHF